MTRQERIKKLYKESTRKLESRWLRTEKRRDVMEQEVNSLICELEDIHKILRDRSDRTLY